MSKILWSNVFAVLGFLLVPSAVAIIYYVRFETPIQNINYPIFIWISLAWGVMILGVLGSSETHNKYFHFEKFPWWKKIPFALGKFSEIFVFIGALLFLSNMLTNGIMANYENSIGFWIFTAMVVYNLFCFFFLRPQRVIKENCITIINGHVHYPGTRVSIYPFIRYTTDAVLAEHEVHLGAIKLNCADGTYTVSVSAKVLIGVGKLEQCDIVLLDKEAFELAEADWIKRTMKVLARTMTVGELTTQKGTHSTSIQGIFVTWCGNTKVEIHT